MDAYTDPRPTNSPPVLVLGAMNFGQRTPEPEAVQQILADPNEPSDDSPTPGRHAGDSPHAPASDLDAYKQPRCDPNDPMCGGL